MPSQIKLRRGTAAQWTSANPTLAAGEAGFETDTNQLKIGNGTDNWETLEYISADLSPYLLSSSASTIYATIVSPDFSGNAFIDGTLLTSGSVSIQNTLSASVVQAETGDFQSILTDALSVGDVSDTEIQYLNGVTSSIQTQIDSKTSKNLDVLTQRSSSFTIVQSDKDCLIPVNGTLTVTIKDAYSTHNFPVGTQIHFLNTGSGTVTFSGGTETLNATPGSKLRAQYSSATLIKYSLGVWVLVGDLAA